MIYGLYLSAQGADVQSHRLDVVANNIANAQTTAFKRDLAIFQAHLPRDVAQGGTGAGVPGNLDEQTGGITLAGVLTDFSQGPLAPTGGTYDVALAGPGFLKVAGPGEELLTRSGRLTVDSRGELVTQSTGHSVLGAGGRRIRIPSEAAGVQIDTDGTVRALHSDGGRAVVGQLDVVLPEDTRSLQKVGDGYYRNPGRQRTAPPGVVQIRQGYVEGSGAQAVLETLDMIDASRAFETNVNMIRAQDEALGRLLQSAARV